MINKKQAFIFITVLFLVLTLTSISATDDTTSDTTTDNTIKEVTTNTPTAISTNNIQKEDTIPKEINNNNKTITKNIKQNTKETDIDLPDIIYVKSVEPYLNITVNKLWERSYQSNSNKPSVNVNLVADGKIVDKCVLNSSNKWVYTFENMPEVNFTTGKIITYNITEDPIANHSSYVTGDPYYGFSLINVENMDITVKKIWDDNDDELKIRPDEIKIRLTIKLDPPEPEIPSPDIPYVPPMPSEIIGSEIPEDFFDTGYNYGIFEFTVTSKNNWTYVINNLPKYTLNGAPIEYVVEEITPRGYKQTAHNYEYNYEDYYYYSPIKHTFINKVQESIDIPILKIWQDSYMSRPNSIKVELYANNEKVNSTTLTGSSLDKYWYSTFTGLPVTDKNGNYINYSVKEVVPEGYNSIILDNGAEGFCIINTLLKNITIKKIWDDNDNDLKIRPGKLRIVLYRSPYEQQQQEQQQQEQQQQQQQQYPQPQYIIPRSEIIAEFNLSEENNWTKVINDLPAYGDYGLIDYYVIEDTPRGYVITDNTIIRRNTLEFHTITNKVTPQINISISKTWDDDYYSNNNIRPSNITVNLFANGQYSQSLTITPRYLYLSRWEGKFENLDLLDQDGNFINYTINETVPEGYSATITGNASSGFQIINTLSKNVTLKKVWLDGNNKLGIRPGSLMILVYRGPQQQESQVQESRIPIVNNYPKQDYPTYGEQHIDPYYPYYYRTYTLVNVINLTSDDDWTKVLENIPSLYKHEFIEIVPTGYELIYEEQSYENGETITFTNKLTPINITVTKQWNDNNITWMRPSNVTVNLLANGKKVMNISLTGNINDNTWTGKFENLPVFDDNNKIITYTINEEPNGYITDISGNATSGFKIVNTRYSNLTVKKIWLDGNNKYGKRPTSIHVSIYKQNSPSQKTFIRTVTLSESNSWSQFVDKLPYDPNAHYTFEEDTINSYEYVSTTLNGNVYEIRNKLKPYNVTIEKVWHDSNNVEGLRPENVLIEFHDNNYILTEKNKWKTSITVPLVDDSGKLLDYSVKEHEVRGYTTRITGNVIDGYVITNSRTPEFINLTITKSWSDNNNQDGKRPSTVTVRLYADNSYKTSFVLTAKDNWKHTITHLYKYANGKEIRYTLEEESVNSYSTRVNGLNIVNTHIPERTEIQVTKTWNDHNNRDHIRPSSIMVRLEANGEVYSTIRLNESNNWKHTFNNLPKYRNGKLISYSVHEIGIPQGYVVSYNGYHIINTHTPEVTEVNVIKNWDDHHDQDGLRPTSIRVQLYANNKAVGAPITLNNANNWEHTYDNLAKYDNGKLITYRVDEVSIPNGYTHKVTHTQNNYIITNTHKPNVTSVKVTKTWKDNNNRDGKRPHSIVVELRANGELYSTATLSAGNNWNHDFNNLPAYRNGKKISYDVVELGVPDGYMVSYNHTHIINTYNPEVTEVTVIKDWEDDHNRDNIRPNSIKIQLYANGKAMGSPVTLNANKNWEHIFNNLPKYDNGKIVTYTVDEISNVNGYIKSIKNNKNSFIITNTHKPESINITIKKVWNDKNNNDHKRPNSVQVELLSDDKVIRTITLNDDNKWKYTVHNLPKYNEGKLIKYTVFELNVPEEYNVKYNGYTITNTYVPEVTEVTVIKDWEDDHNRDNIRPNSIKIQLYANGKAMGNPVTLNANKNWEHIFNNLPKYDNGKIVTYTVDEINVPAGYTKLVSSSHNAYVITNIHKPKVTSLTVTKIWDDNNNNDKRSNNVTVDLFSDGELYDTVVLSAANNWTYKFTNLPKYDQGRIIHYIIYEVNVPEDYIATYNGTTIINTYNPDITQVNVIKVWNDSHNRDNKRPSSVSVQLYADGEKLGSPVKLDANNDWKYTFNGLDKIVNGKTVHYTVDEVGIPKSYTKSIEGTDNTYIITNSYVAEVTNFTVNKIWNDSDNRDGIRPKVMNIDLFADGELYQTITLTSEKWNYTFTDLPVRFEGKVINYVAYETSIPEGYTVSYDGNNIINTHVPEKVQVEVIKQWDDNYNSDNTRPNSISVQLYANNEKLYQPVVLNSKNDWSYLFNDLPKYENGTLINYTVDEVKVPKGYTKIVKNISHTFTITNYYEAKVTNLTVRKVWNDSDNRDGIRPESITIDLFADGELYQTIKLNNTSWKYTFTNLPVYNNGKKIVYTVNEYGIPTDYIVSYDGYKITNTHIPAVTEVVVIKQWEDDHDRDGLRPDNVKVQLYADGSMVGTPVILSSKNNWEHIFENLPKYNKGHLITYTISETEVPGYTTTTIDKNNTIIIVNSHEISLSNITILKIWNDNNNQDGLRPYNVKVDLFADGELVANVILTAKDGWSYTFNNLPTYYNGKAIQYSVYEVSLTDDYTVSYDGYTITNTHIPEVIEINVIKEWEDNHNSKGLRSESVTVELYADGKATGDIIVLTNNNNWEYLFTNLPKYANGKEIVYTVKETDIAEEYTQTIKQYNNTFIIINTIKLETPTKFGWGWYLIGVNGSYNDDYRGNVTDKTGYSDKIGTTNYKTMNKYIRSYGNGRYNKYYNGYYNRYYRNTRYYKNHYFNPYRGIISGQYQYYRLYIYLIKEYLTGNITPSQFIAILDESHIEHFNENGMIIIDYENLEDVPENITVEDTTENIPTTSDNIDTSNPDNYEAPKIDGGEVEVPAKEVQTKKNSNVRADTGSQSDNSEPIVEES